MKRCSIIILLLLCCVWTQAQVSEYTRLLRFPHSVGDKLVFSYGGDIYLAGVDGGVARRLTSDIGYEMFPRLSPDGKFIAFTGQYDGNTEVYVMPSEGGEPLRLTYTATLKRDDLGDRMGPNNVVIGWTPDSKQILFRSRQYSFNDFTGQLFLVSVEGGMLTEVPLKNGGFASYAPDGEKLAYNYIFREFRSWKRYTGGMADDIRIFDAQTKKSEKITDNIHQNIIPMWSPTGEEVYYISDRGGIMNLYAYHTKTKQTRQLTAYDDYDIKFPSIGDQRIVYELGGEIHQYDLATAKSARIPVQVRNDEPYARSVWMDVKDQITDRAPSPDGKRVLVAARGDIFSLPAQEGITYNLTNSSNAHDRSPAWSPDGKYISYISDKDGEFNIYIRELASGNEKKLIDGLKGYIFGYQWSPDSKKIAWSEKQNTLNISDVATGRHELVEQSGIGPLNSFNWSPDSRYITYVRPGKAMSDIVIYAVDSKQKHLITDGWYNVGSPNFSQDGKYLLFSSARTFSPTYSRTEWNHAYVNMNKVYILPLSKDALNPFAPKNDGMEVKAEAETGAAGSGKDKGKGKAVEKEKKGIEYVFDDIERRIIELPVIAADYYSNLHMFDQNVFYNRGGGTMVFDLKSKKESAANGRLQFTPGYKKGLAISGNSFQVVDMPVTSASVSKAVPVNEVKRLVNYTEEWTQIFDESWRQMRDFFYAKNMHGVDWDRTHLLLKDLLPYVKHRTDLTYIIGEMIGDLNVGHAYSQNGECPKVRRIPMGLLGARFKKDQSGYFRVERIIEGANWNEKTRSPLTQQGVDVKEGDYILSINGRSLKDVPNLFMELIDKAGKTVELEVNTKASPNGARKVLVVPLADESQLYYYDWVQNNIRRVNEASGGEVGYIHIPDMGPDGLNEFVKHYYPQLTKKALIIDDRGNGGGNVSPMIMERLLRTPDFYTMHTNQTEGSVSPVGTFLGPKVLLVNEYSASDGDLFPYRFQYNKLGTIIGRRTWGGVVGYSGSIRVVDGGSIVTPSYAPYAADGSEFIIEGRGVTPDIDVENDPYLEFNGTDQQLEKAIELILEKLKTERKDIPAIPEFPDKSR